MNITNLRSTLELDSPRGLVYIISIIKLTPSLIRLIKTSSISEAITVFKTILLKTISSLLRSIRYSKANNHLADDLFKSDCISNQISTAFSLPFSITNSLVYIFELILINIIEISFNKVYLNSYTYTSRSHEIHNLV